jgi:superfamily II DNA/RNA helicase
VLDLLNIKISAIALTKDNFEEHINLWKRVEAGEFRMVYATPEILLEHRGHFLLDVVKSDCPFIKNLIAVAIDECHLVWDWEDFRQEYGDIGKLRSLLSRVPFICLSATLTPNVAAYVHQVCRLSYSTVRFNLPIRRDNINLIVSKIDRPGIDHLLDRIPKLHPNSDHKTIRKTLIFYDKIDPGIDIANELIARLPPTVNKIPADTIVASYYSTLDAKAKSKTLADLRKGDTRIVICTDAFGLGIDIPDIEVVIQWHVDEKLMASTLYQRIGRAARGKDVEGIAVVYIQKSLLDSIAKKNWAETMTEWQNVWKDDHETLVDLAVYDIEQTMEGLCVVPVSKERDIRRFGLPVRVDTEFKVKKHILSLYSEAASLREAFRQAKREIRGNRQNQVSMAKKLDPPVLWFICTQGCRHMVFGMIFQDIDVLMRSHRHWCCDWCSFHSDEHDLKKHTTAGISVDLSMLNPNPPSKPVATKTDSPAAKVRAEKITLRHIGLIRWRLIKLREAIWKTLPYPDTDPDIVFTDKVLEHVMSNLNRIVSPEDVVNVMVKAGVSPQLSLLSEMHIIQIYLTIDSALLNKVPDIPIAPRPPVINGISYFSCLAKYRYSYNGFTETPRDKT